MARYFRHREPPLFIVTARKDLLPRFDLSIERVSLSIVFLFERVSPPKFHSRRSSTIHPRIRSTYSYRVLCIFFWEASLSLYKFTSGISMFVAIFILSFVYSFAHYVYIYVYIGLSFGFFVSKNSFETIGRSYSFQFRPKHSINELNGPSRKSFKRIKMLNVTFFR